MKIRFYIDPETDHPHIYNHDVRENEVEEVLQKPGEDRPARKTIELLSDRHRVSDIFELFMPPILSPTVYL